MSTTPIGVLIMVLGLYGFVKNQKFLLGLTVFFIPFSATAVINIGAKGAGSSIQPFMFLGLLNYALIIVKSAKKKYQFKTSKSTGKAFRYLLFFLFVVLLSLLMPIIINGTEYGNTSGALGNWNKIEFTNSNITQFIYLCIGASFSYIFYYYGSQDENIYRFILRIFTYSLVFVMLWGVFQYFCIISGRPYPSEIFNNSSAKALIDYGAENNRTGDEGVQRISSVAIEASVLVQNFLIILPFLFFDRLYKGNLLKRKYELPLFFCFCIFIMMSTSSSGIVCLIFTILYLAYKFLKTKKSKQRIIYLLLTLFLLLLGGTIAFYAFHDILVIMLFNKGDSYSAMERTGATIQAWHSFLSHPILGVGWGAVTTFDLFVKILSNVGVLGFIPFLLLIIQLIHNQNKKNLIGGTYKEYYYSIAVTVSLIITLFNNAISGFTFMFGNFWFIVGLAFVTYFKKDFKQ